MNILLVDDADINLRIYKSILRNISGLTFHCFTLPAEALEWSLKNRAHLVIVDYTMPEIDGIQFIERFRSNPANAHTSIVMVTAETESKVRYHALDVGANDFLTKPVDAVELAVRAKNMVALADAQIKASEHGDRLAAGLRDSESGTIQRLIAAAAKSDGDAMYRAERIGKVAGLIGTAAGLGPLDIEGLVVAAQMHDIGMVATPDVILQKTGPLHPEERTIMQRHTTIGHHILKDANSPLLRLAADVALSHHEHFDGSGYPRRIAGEAIPLFARICAVADVYDALRSDRPHREAWGSARAAAHIESLWGTQFDPVLAPAFRAALPEISKTMAAFLNAA
ncbi:MAG: HD domain-containing phosphohydrolase [Candidatus Baltobacteraceae bacterium]